MIGAYDDYGNVVDLVEWEKQIREDAIDEMLSKIYTTWLFRRDEAKAYREEIDYIAEQLKEQNK